MKKLSILFFLFFLNFNTSALPYSTEPKEFVSELVNDAINKLSDKNLTNEEKSKYIEKIALENVDIKALGLYTLGELRKSSEKKDLINYQIAFEKYFLNLRLVAICKITALRVKNKTSQVSVDIVS